MFLNTFIINADLVKISLCISDPLILDSRHPDVTGETLKPPDFFLSGLGRKWLNLVLKMKMLQENVLIETEDEKQTLTSIRIC